ncbi:MAG: protein-disulfide reductase DsbD [Acidobacteriota bacterium]|nr:protein-disulfide reductase DsbD [Acidobacteriota bacterium]
MKRIIVFSVLLFVSFALFFSQEADEVIAVKIVSSVSKFKAGQSFPIALELHIKDLYHINSEQPSQEFLVPTLVTFDANDNLAFGTPSFPPATLKVLEFSDKPLAVYEGKFNIFSTVTLGQSFHTSELEISGNIEYQACDNNTCLSPDVLHFNQTFPVAAENESVMLINQEIFSSHPPAIKNEEDQNVEEMHFASTIGGQGLFLTFVLIFLGGLALNLTPCVYPLIPITIGYFGGQVHGKKGGAVTHALLYVLGMAITYSTLGVIAALTGGLFGAALQKPFVLITIAIVLVALALSMFNMYEFRLPSFLTNLAGGRKSGFVGTFLMGLTVGFVAAPCIGPFVIGLLTYVGEKGNVFLGFWMFFALALGLGLPFLFLAIFSGSIDRLPRSGAWMVWVRSIFGFILLSMAIYFLHPLFPNDLFYHMTLALTMCLGGIYMAWIEPTKLGGKVFSVIRNLVGVAFFVVALIIGVNGIQAHMHKMLVGSDLRAGTSHLEKEIQWFAFSENKLKEAKAQSKPVLIDFHADWCIPCIEMDKITFSEPEVIEMSRNFMMLKMDITTRDNPNYQNIKKKFQIIGVPTLVFLRPDGIEAKRLRIIEFVKKDKLLEKMNKAF